MSTPAHRQIVIGLVGQVCAGKSTVANAFRKHGARVYSADKFVHELYERPDVKEEVRQVFGTQVLDASGNVIRSALGAIVFSDAAKLKQLTEKIIFPRTGAEIEKVLKEFRQSGAAAIILDAPTLFESGRESLCDHIVFVSAPDERRKIWAKARGWDEAQLRQRDCRMIDEKEKRLRACAVIDNAGSIEELEIETGALLNRWTKSGDPK